MKYLIGLLSLLSSLLAFSSVEITTIDSWRIVNAGSHSLLVNKFSENPDSMNLILSSQRWGLR